MESFRLSCAASDKMRSSFKSEMTATPKLRYGALDTVFNDGFSMSNTNFLLVFSSNFTSIMHLFRDNDVFLPTGNDVIVISPSYIVVDDGF